MDEFKIEKWTLEDGRRAERRVMDQKNCDDGTSEKLVELHVEDERPMRLKQRVTEKSKPIVYERKIETIDEKTGDVIDQKIESIEPKVQMQLVEHITSQEVSAQNVVVEHDCHVTKQEMIETIIEAIKASQSVSVRPTEPIKFKSKKSKNSDDLKTKLNSLGLADEIAEKVETSSGLSVTSMMIYVLIALELVALYYIAFVM